MLSYNIIIQYGNSIYNGESIDMLAIDKAMVYEYVSEEDRGLLAQKIISWFSVASNITNERMKNGK